jgi:hypothetical protein
MVNKRVGNMRRDNDGRGNSFQYVPAKSDFVKKQTERRLGRQFDGIFKDKYLQLSKLQEGDNRFRILPATWKPHDDFAYVVWVHKYMEGGSYVCPAKMFETRCPICEEQQQAKRDKDDERSRELYPSETMVCWVVDRKSREFEDRPQLYAMPPTLYKDICGVIYDTETGKATMIDHDRKGYDIRVKRTGTKLNTRYLPMLANTPTPITADRDTLAEILAYITKNPVPDCLEVKSEKYLDKIMSGTAGKRDPDLDEDDEDVDDDEDEAPKKRKKGAKAYGDDDEDEDEPAPRKRPKLRAADDEDDEDQDQDDDQQEEDEDDEPAPKKRRKITARDDDEADEDDDEPAPRRKKKAAAADDEDDDADEDAPKPRRKLRAAPAEDEDDEDEPRPKRKKLRAAAEPEEEDEDADDQTDDDDDEDAPPPKRRGRTEGRRASR